MEIFNYIAVAVSIILGLGLTCLLDGASNLILARRRISVYWIHIVWVIIAILLHIQFWWGFWRFHTFEEWTLISFVAYLSAPICLFVLGDLAFPDFRESPQCMRKHYYEHHRWFFGVLASYLLIVIITSSTIPEGGHWLQASNGVRLLAFGIALASAISKSEILHGILCILGFVVLVVFVLVFNSATLEIQSANSST